LHTGKKGPDDPASRAPGHGSYSFVRILRFTRSTSRPAPKLSATPRWHDLHTGRCERCRRGTPCCRRWPPRRRQFAGQLSSGESTHHGRQGRAVRVSTAIGGHRRSIRRPIGSFKFSTVVQVEDGRQVGALRPLRLLQVNFRDRINHPTFKTHSQVASMDFSTTSPARSKPPVPLVVHARS